MANDFKRKEPTKTEKMIYDLMVNQQMMDHNLISNSAHIVALGILLKADPDKIAELLVNGDQQIKDYGAKINEAIKKLQEQNKTKPVQPSQAA